MPSHVSQIVEMYSPMANPGRALDIACGTGRNSVYLAENGFSVDAVDISDYALAQIPASPMINRIEADLDEYRFARTSYDLIVNCNFLYRDHFPMILDALRPKGILIYETFVEKSGEGFHQPSNPDFLLKNKELLDAFRSLEVICYEEKVATNLRGELVNIASFVGRQGG